MSRCVVNGHNSPCSKVVKEQSYGKALASDSSRLQDSRVAELRKNVVGVEALRYLHAIRLDAPGQEYKQQTKKHPYTYPVIVQEFDWPQLYWFDCMR